MFTFSYKFSALSLAALTRRRKRRRCHCPKGSLQIVSRWLDDGRWSGVYGDDYWAFSQSLASIYV